MQDYEKLKQKLGVINKEKTNEHKKEIEFSE